MITQGRDLRTKLCRLLSEEVLLGGNESVARIKLVYTHKRIHLQILRNPSEATLGERKQYLATKEN